MNISRPAVFLALALHTAAQAGVNLLANPSAQNGASNGWSIVANGGDGWATRGDSADGDGACFITSYNWCTRSQTIDLPAAGYTPEFLDSSPPILVREFFKGFNNVSDSYFLRVELRDVNGAVLEFWEAGNQAAPLTATGNWELQEHRFENYPAGVREIYWEDGGDDVVFFCSSMIWVARSQLGLGPKPRDFLRHSRGLQMAVFLDGKRACTQASPLPICDDAIRRLCFGYPSTGCFPAEPVSVSPKFDNQEKLND